MASAIIFGLYSEDNSSSVYTIDASNLRFEAFVKMNDSMEVTSNGFHIVRIKLLKVNHLKSLKLYLLRNMDAAEKIIFGKFEGNSQLHSIVCAKCDQADIDGQNYILNIKPDALPPYELTYLAADGKSIRMNLTPQNSDDLIHIDLAFDDGGILSEFAKRLRDTWKYFLQRYFH